MAFGWSAGDILAALKFIIDVAQALDDVKGAPQDFRKASTFLRSLDKALAPLRTFTALDANPEYKADIESEVDAIRKPVEAFMKDVEGFTKRFGDGSTSTGTAGAKRFRALRNVGSKLEWHYSTSKKAIALQKEIEGHLKIIDILMQRLTMDMLHELQKDMKGDIQGSVSNAFNTHLSPFRANIIAEISNHDDLSRSTWLGQLEEILERYLGSQKLMLRSSPSPSLPPPYNTAELTASQMPADHIIDSFPAEGIAALLERLLIRRQPYLLPEKTGGVTADPEITYQLRLWWTRPSSDLLWIHGIPTDVQLSTPSLAANVVAVAREAHVPVLWYTCTRLDISGNEIPQADLFVDLLCSLMQQILQQNAISSSLDDPDLSLETFSPLEKSPSSIPRAMTLLRKLLALALKTTRLLIVLDGMQLLDYSGNVVLESHIRELLQALQGESKNATAATGPVPIIKTLVTTEDQTLLLLDVVKPEQIVECFNLEGSGGFLSVAEFRDGGDRLAE